MTTKINELVKALLKMQHESEWLEFKKANADADTIGKNISALANGAVISNRTCAYKIWGVDDLTHEIVGTTFSPYDKAHGNQELLSWLHGMTSENAEFHFDETLIDGHRVVVLTIQAAQQYPVTFKKEAYIRMGSYTKRLAEEKALQVKLWGTLSSEIFERAVAKADLTASGVEGLLSVATYFDTLGMPVPGAVEEKLKYLIKDQLINVQDNGLFAITNAAALLFAKDLNDFPSVSRKAIRIAVYDGITRQKIAQTRDYSAGYALACTRAFDFLDGALPHAEPVASNGVRHMIEAFPSRIVRELLVNALIHQDLSLRGMGVICEVFDNRIEISNPGTLLVDKNRIIDMAPRSRNERLSTLFRRMKLCEELGLGWDLVVQLSEQYQLPVPEIIQYPDATRVTIYSHVDFFALTKEQKLWSCYSHSAKMLLEGKSATNASFRERFGLDKKSASTVSRLFSEAVKAKLIKPKEEAVGSRAKSYVPFWV